MYQMSKVSIGVKKEEGKEKRKDKHFTDSYMPQYYPATC